MIKILNNIRKYFIRKGLVLVLYENRNSAEFGFEQFEKSLTRDKRLFFRYKQKFIIHMNGYNIMFISKLSELHKVRGTRPEVIYLNTTSVDTQKEYDLNKYLYSSINHSSRLSPLRDNFNYENCNDILSDDFKIKEYIDIKSLGYKLTRNKYIKNKIKILINKLIRRRE
ncbi:hypothetical protein DVV91_09965 [Clostridium botulinum]|uniref:hypothetical protein n=1 Tax=Clostridium botulinum TaxID=1491 RepID=UPI001967B173|nr:hypothetical protein [Clostridium botulinum]MBN1074666.1 hypothetical protein [Clostridium botulinum]